MNTLSNCLVNIHVYTHWLVMLSALAREFSFWSREQSAQGLIFYQSAENRRLRAQPKSDMSIFPLSPGPTTQGTPWELRWEECEGWRMGRELWDCLLGLTWQLYLWTHSHWSWPHKTFSRLSCQHSSPSRGIIGNWRPLGEESPFSSRVWALFSCSWYSK